MGHRWNWPILCGALLLTGCGTAGLNGFLADLGRPKISATELQSRRAKFSQERDPAAFRWLLTHTLENGMSVQEVDHALGDSGERIYDDLKLKTQNEGFHQTDVAYKWGPDSEGRSVVLFFREGRLIQYSPEKFAGGNVPESW